LTEAVHSGIVDGISSLREDPLPDPPLKKKLKGFGFSLYRLRVGDYRLLYRIEETTVTVMRVVARKDLDRSVRNIRRG
jgi:mRNA-degrading endonuclease RelE of RelBE toxin-antitoxin system